MLESPKEKASSTCKLEIDDDSVPVDQNQSAGNPDDDSVPVDQNQSAGNPVVDDLGEKC
jgi:hypothetical protein